EIIAFPDYEKVLKREGIIRSTIAYESHLQQMRRKLSPLPLDAEVAEVLAEVAWKEFDFAELHRAIDVAYARVCGRLREQPTCVALEDFPEHSKVREVFDSPLGFQVRGRRFFDLLQMNKRGEADASLPAGIQALK